MILNILLKHSKYFFIFLLFGFSSSLYSLSGLYFTPKFSFYPYLPEYKINDNIEYDYSIGGAIVFGYDFSRLSIKKPFRVDIEYLANISLSQIKYRTDNFLLNAYYDLYFFDSLILKDKTVNNKFLSSIYIGVNVGISILSELDNKWYEKNTLVNSKNMIHRQSIIGGINAGFMWHIRGYIALDLGYKWLISPLIRDSHEVLLGLKFTMI